MSQPLTAATGPARCLFRWRYIILPLAVLVLSSIIALFFYHVLPDEVAYHLKSDGSPDRWLSRNMILAWLLVPQLFLTFAAAAVTGGASWLVLAKAPAATLLRIEAVIALMGNMLALPQLVLCFAMVDIFSYNSYGTKLVPIWALALIVVLSGTVILGAFFARAVRRRARPSP